MSIVPDHPQSLFFLGKLYQRLEQHEQALAVMERVIHIDPANHLYYLEVALEAAHNNDMDKAIHYGEEGLKFSPDHIAILGNHAMYLMIAGRDAEAMVHIQRAISIAPEDTVNKFVARIIKEVTEGKRKRPSPKEAFEITK